MGFRFRKSVNFGSGFRINFSKSGIGYSFGGKGFRYTKTARGTSRTTLSIPGTGISWVEESGKSMNPSNTLTGTPDSSYLFSIENENEVYSADFKTFLEAIKHFIKINRLLTWLSVAALAIFIYGTVQTVRSGNFGVLFALSMIAFAAVFVWKIVYRLVGPVKASYDMTSPEGQYRVDHLQKILESLKSCNAVWQVNDVYANSSSRRNGGASRSVRLTKLNFQSRRPYFLQTNATIYFVKLKKEKLYILPDVIIVEGKKGFGAAALKDLHISIKDTRFIANTAPMDSTILSYTWRYVNNNGTPDKRFKNNVRLPVCQFGLVELKTLGGFHTMLYLSSIQKTKQLSDIVVEMIQHGNASQREQQSED